MGADAAAAAASVETLAAQLGWRSAASEDAGVLEAAVGASLGRREHLLAATRHLSEGEQEAVRGGLSGVRFLDLAGLPPDASAILAAMRREFGV